MQRFRHWLYWLPITIATAMVWWQFIQQVVLGRPQGTDPIPDWLAWALTVVFGIGLPVLALTVRLIIEVMPGVVSVRFAPLRARTIRLADVREVQAREYSPQREFGGWGIRTGPNGRAYTALGDQGVELTLADGTSLLLGTQRPDELVEALYEGGADLGG